LTTSEAPEAIGGSQSGEAAAATEQQAHASERGVGTPRVITTWDHLTGIAELQTSQQRLE